MQHGGALDFAVGSHVDYGGFAGCTVAVLHADGSVDINIPGVGIHPRVARSAVRLVRAPPPPPPPHSYYAHGHSPHSHYHYPQGHSSHSHYPLYGSRNYFLPSPPPLPSPLSLPPPSHPPYSPPPGVTVAHALALVATGIVLWLSLVASDLSLVASDRNGSSFSFIVELGIPFVLALPLALQLEMPQLLFEMEVVVCIAAAGCGLYVFSTSSSMSYLPIRNIEKTTLPLKGALASLALLVTALNALIPAAAVYTLLPLVWAVGSGYAISGWLACEKEGVGEKDERLFFGQFLTIVGSVVTLPLAVLPWVEAMPGGLKDILSFAGTAMALLHLSMAFWLSGGKPHIVVAWVGSAVMGLALSLPPLFPQSNTSLRSHQAFLVFLGVSLGLALVFVLIFFLKKSLLALPGPELPTETGSDDQGASQPFDHSSNVLPPEQPLPPPVIGILVDNRVTAAVNARVSYCCPCPCWPAADADAIEDNMTA